MAAVASGVMTSAVLSFLATVALVLFSYSGLQCNFPLVPNIVTPSCYIKFRKFRFIKLVNGLPVQGTDRQTDIIIVKGLNLFMVDCCRKGGGGVGSLTLPLRCLHMRTIVH